MTKVGFSANVNTNSGDGIVDLIDASTLAVTDPNDIPRGVNSGRIINTTQIHRFECHSLLSFDLNDPYS